MIVPSREQAYRIALSHHYLLKLLVRPVPALPVQALKIPVGLGRVPHSVQDLPYFKIHQLLFKFAVVRTASNGL